MMVLAIIALLAAIAIPSFTKYVRRSRSSEAAMNLRKMYDGAIAYYLADRADTANVALPRRFPDNSGPTPATPPAATAYRSAPAEWKTGGWLGLDFMIADPQYYSYSFVSSGTGAGATAAMIAQGDLNGNGVYSLFRRDCTATTDGVTGGAGLFTLNETE
jgi:type II secretory pathway pseudopilin PulG